MKVYIRKYQYEDVSGTSYCIIAWKSDIAKWIIMHYYSNRESRDFWFQHLKEHKIKLLPDFLNNGSYRRKINADPPNETDSVASTYPEP